jgi:hypothetical protein
MWREFEREVNKQPQNILVSLRAKILEVMAKIGQGGRHPFLQESLVQD